MQERRIVTFGRRKSRELSNVFQDLINNSLSKLNPCENFKLKYQNYCLEIGFGDGSHIANQAKNNPNIGYIGCDTYINGTANLLNLINNFNLTNIAVLNDDARDLLINIKDNFFDKIYILFPDPWPKHRHHKRRLINQENLEVLYSKLKKNSQLIIATDHIGYAEWIYKKLQEFNHFILKDKVEEYQNEPENWIKTKYQKKAENININPYFFVLEKNENS